MNDGTSPRVLIESRLWDAIRLWSPEAHRYPNGLTPIDLLGRMPPLPPDPSAGGARPQDRQAFRAIAAEFMWDLATQGVLMLRCARSDAYEHLYLITEYGQNSVDAGELTPHDQDFIPLIEREVGQLDAVTKLYLTEALNAFQNRLYLAAVFMLGAASERAFMLLSDAWFGKQKNDPPYALFKKMQRRIAALLESDDSFKRGTTEAAGRDDWLYRLETGFNIYRVARNEAGHPNLAKPIDRTEARDYFMVFRPYIKVVFGLRRFFQAQGIPFGSQP